MPRTGKEPPVGASHEVRGQDVRAHGGRDHEALEGRGHGERDHKAPEGRGHEVGGAHVRVGVRRIDEGLPLPSYAHEGDAGADLCAAADVELAPGARALVPTGVAVALPPGYVGLVHPRSGLAHRLGVTVLNAPGTVDAGYRGEIMVNLVNHDPVSPAKIARGDRIAQLVVQRVERADFYVVDELPDTSRGIGGHGSTGGHTALSVPAQKE